MYRKALISFGHLFIFILLSQSCSVNKSSSETQFKFNLGSVIDTSQASAGGAFIWGKSSNGDQFGSVVDMASLSEFDLVNGAWTFWSIIWEGNGTGERMTGVARCGKTTFNLVGGNAVVNLTLSNNNCGVLPDFSPATSFVNGIYKFPQIVHNECESLSDHAGVGCKKTNGKAKTVSKRFILPSFKKFGDRPIEFLPGHLSSQCRGVNEAMVDENIPPGNGFIPLVTSLNSFYSSPNCDNGDPKGVRVTQYDFGLSSSARFDSRQFITFGTCTGINVFNKSVCESLGGYYSGACSGLNGQDLINMDPSVCRSGGGIYTDDITDRRMQVITSIPSSELCSGPRADINHHTPHGFSSGDGSVNSPFTICKETQLNNIGSNYLNSNFSLQAHLNMNRTSILGDQPRPQCDKDIGANFVPIGALYDDYPSCIDLPNAASPFSGIFNGNGFSISNIRLNSNHDEIGFIRNGGTVLNTVFVNPKIKGGAQVGTVMGVNPTLIKNVKVYGAKVSGSHMLGGLVGAILAPTGGIELSEVFNGYIDQDYGHINDSLFGGNETYILAMSAGGLVGSTDQSFEFKKSSFNGLIYSRIPGAVVGGILGNAEVNATTRETFSTGSLHVIGSSNAGGLVGNANGSVFSYNSYSRMSIGISNYDSTNTSGNLGGLVGNSSETNALNSYYYGSILHNCTDAASACTVGALSAFANPLPAITSANSSRSFLIGKGVNSDEPFVSHNSSTRALFESGGDSPNTLFPSREPSIWVNVGAPFPRLAWEKGECQNPLNNLSLALQAAAPYYRGLSSSAPLILCHYNQWLELPSFSSLHSKFGDNIVIGEIPAASSTALFAGKIDGNGFILSGFLSTLSANGGGLFKTISANGEIKNLTFASGRIVGTGASVGMFGDNYGKIANSNFVGISVLGYASNAGVVAGQNYGLIKEIAVDGLNKSLGNVGLIVGTNQTSSEIQEARVTGQIIQVGSSSSGVGGAAGINNGSLKKIEISSVINNRSAVGNSDSLARFGAFVGKNNGLVEDILVTQDALMNIERSGPTYGSVFGSSSSTSISRRVLAVNEIGLMATGIEIPTFAHFTGENSIGATYDKCVTLSGGVFDYRAAVPFSITATNIVNSPVITYTSDNNYVADALYPDGYFIPTYNGRKSVSRRLFFSGGIGSHVLTTITTDLDNMNHFSISDSSLSGAAYLVRLRSNFSPVMSVSPLPLQQLNTYCSSFKGASIEEQICDEPGGFDIVKTTSGATGFARLYRAYAAMFDGGTLDSNFVKPTWVYEDNEPYPRLFLKD